jgi:hypothetical protein
MGYQVRLTMVKSVVWLTEEERAALTEVIGKGKAAARKIEHANLLLKLDAEGARLERCACRRRLRLQRPHGLRHPATLCRSRFGGGAGVQEARAPAARERIPGGDGEAHLLRLACSAPPEGPAR